MSTTPAANVIARMLALCDTTDDPPDIISNRVGFVACKVLAALTDAGWSIVQTGEPPPWMERWCEECGATEGLEHFVGCLSTTAYYGWHLKSAESEVDEAR